MKKLFVPKKIRARLRSSLTVAALLALNVLPAFAQSTTFNSTDLKTGISNSLAVIMMFGFVLGISAVIYGGFAIRRGDVDQGKMSIIGGAIIAAAPAAVLLSTKSSGWTATARSASAAFKRRVRIQSSIEYESRTAIDRYQRRIRSKGRTWGLEGGLFWWLIGGIGAGITLFFVLLVVVVCRWACPSLWRSCRCWFALLTSLDCGRANHPVTTGTFLNTPSTAAASAPKFIVPATIHFYEIRKI